MSAGINDVRVLWERREGEFVSKTLHIYKETSEFSHLKNGEDDIYNSSHFVNKD